MLFLGHDYIWDYFIPTVAISSNVAEVFLNILQEVLSPVENLRRQLKKLEELEDQFPLTTNTDTYMRYPFTDNAQFGSSEIEFFKHRYTWYKSLIKNLNFHHYIGSKNIFF